MNVSSASGAGAASAAGSTGGDVMLGVRRGEALRTFPFGATTRARVAATAVTAAPMAAFTARARVFTAPARFGRSAIGFTAAVDRRASG